MNLGVDCGAVFIGSALTRPRRRELADVVRYVAGRAGRRVFCDPRHLAAGFGARLDDRGPVECGPETGDPDWIRYHREGDPREDGLRVFHRLAHLAIARSGYRASEADVWLLTADLVMPRDWRRRFADADQAARAQVHAPHWFLDGLYGVQRAVAPSDSGIVRVRW
jgi:hypothetical protein